ncbi:hypothetical protein B0H34DRAFT_530004 [Crassisporium funariophilum]|nr:hypothetical protein B0H34DRAFT_530004 [Crassisporium funariophilum]
MLPPLRRYSLHAMSSAYRLIKPTSPVSCTVTRSFLTTISDHAPAKPKDKTVGEKKPAPRKKSDVAEKADRPTKSKAARPKIPKKDLVPPFRKPTSGFAR